MFSQSFKVLEKLVLWPFLENTTISIRFGYSSNKLKNSKRESWGFKKITSPELIKYRNMTKIEAMMIRE